MARTNKVKIQFRKASPVTKAAVVAALVLSVVALVALNGSIAQMNSQYDAMRLHAMALESDNESLVEQIDDLGSLESALRIASEELGLTFPDSVIYIPDN